MWSSINNFNVTVQPVVDNIDTRYYNEDRNIDTR